MFWILSHCADSWVQYNFREKPAYEFLKRFNPTQLKQLCDNLSPDEIKALEAYAKTGDTTAAANLPEVGKSPSAIYAQLRNAQAILGVQSFAEASILCLVNERALPSPDKFGLTNRELSFFWYIAHGYKIIKIANLYREQKSVIDREIGNAAKKLDVSGKHASPRALLKLLDINFPIEELLDPDIVSNIKFYIARLTERQREILSIFSNSNRPTQHTVENQHRGTFAKHLSYIAKNFHLTILQVEMLYRYAENIALIREIEPPEKRRNQYST